MASPEFGFLSDLLGFRLKQANQVLLSGSDRRLRPLGISPQQFSILAMISLNPDIIQTRLIENLYITRSTCSDLIEQLIQKKLVKRTAIDRRSFGLSLTEEGAEVMEEARTLIEDHDREVTDHMSAEEVRALVDLLARFSERP